jgi:sulfite reductase (NADPH) hemoprotein beta-component
LGPSFAQEEMPSVIKTIIAVYKANRSDGEKFLDTYKRIGMAPFKEQVYAKAD